jgi:hypothetical protein
MSTGAMTPIRIASASSRLVSEEDTQQGRKASGSWQNVEKGYPCLFGRAPSMARALRAGQLPKFAPGKLVNVACPKLIDVAST